MSNTAEIPYHEALKIARSKLPIDCRIVEVQDGKGASALAAFVPDGMPLVFSDLKWWLASPLTAELLKRYATLKE